MLEKDLKTSDSADGAHRSRKALWPSIVVLIFIAFMTVAVCLWREQISSYAAMGYPAILVVCFILNCGVFGLSPSGAVAIQMSYVFDPVIVPLVAGIGAGLGEATSYYAGKRSTDLIETKYLDKLNGFGQIKTAAVAFVASFVSGNLSDAIGLACGRLEQSFAGYLIGATLAKIAKFYLLVFAARGVIESVGILG